MKSAEIFIKSLGIRDSLKLTNDFTTNPIDDSLLPVLTYRISNKITFLIIGQDPTIKNVTSRQSIEYTLNLDKNGSLRKYVSAIADKLGLRFENVYATNIFKYFYSQPPERTMNVLYNHLEKNLNLLRDEISAYPKVPIITLGLPVLQLLTGDDAQVSYYWDYNKKTKTGGGMFRSCKASDNKLGRDFFPFPHQPSLAKTFYKDTLDAYLKYMKRTIEFE